MSTSFQEFLQQKVEGSDWRNRKHLRTEWLGAINRLFDQIQDWLRESDPEGLIEVVRYVVMRVEGQLGVYDAPAMKIRLNTEEADVIPMGRFAYKPRALETLLSVPTNQQRWGALAGGCVDMSSDNRRHLLIRSTVDGQDCWYALMRNQPTPVAFDRPCLEAILEDLLS